jgi:hypothetical protein
MKNVYCAFGVLPFVALMICTGVAAQAIKLPPTSRTVFKCTVKERVVYSDEPCIGAQRIDVEPTRGMSKSSGQDVVGTDVRREKQREEFARAVQPLTGLSKPQFDAEQRRAGLPANLKAECKKLDNDIAVGEIQEKSEANSTTSGTQANLLSMRRHHKEIGC